MLVEDGPVYGRDPLGRGVPTLWWLGSFTKCLRRPRVHPASDDLRTILGPAEVNSSGQGLTRQDIQDAKDSEGDRGEKRQMVTCPCCHGSGKVSPERAEDLKVIIAEHNLYEEFAG